MAFLRITQEQIKSTWSASVGQIIDDTGSEAYWAKKVKRNQCIYVSDEEAEKACRVLGAYQNKPVFRPHPRYTTNLATNSVRLNLPEKGSFNPGLAKYKDGYVLVYRPDEFRFIACHLDKQFKATGFFPLKLAPNCADPRLIWHRNKLLVIYAGFTEPPERHRICIKGTILIDLDQSEDFIHSPEFRVDPPELIDHQKNWMPFVCDDELYFVAQVCPHIVYKWDGKRSTKVSEVEWDHPWFFKEFLRGNCNCVQLPDGNYLGTFHTATATAKCIHYDNGAYIFEGKHPFRPLKSANRSYLPADMALEPHFRKKGLIRCIFPVGMVLEKDTLLITYGDNDSCCRLMKTTTAEMENTTVELYESQIENVDSGDQLCLPERGDSGHGKVSRGTKVVGKGRSSASARANRNSRHAKDSGTSHVEAEQTAKGEE